VRNWCSTPYGYDYVETDEDGMSPTEVAAIAFGFIGLFTIFIIAAIAF